MDIRHLGHLAFGLVSDETSIPIDPFLTGNPKAAVAADELEPDTILLTHGCADHVGDAVGIAKRTGALVLAGVETLSQS